MDTAPDTELASQKPIGDTSQSEDDVSAEGSSTDFDFARHRREAVDAYEAVRPAYEECAQAVYSVLNTALQAEGVPVHSIEARAKTPESFGEKASIPADDNPNSPKYEDPLAEISDLAGVRVITLLLDTVDRVSSLIEQEFDVLERSTKSGLLEDGERLGYQSVHFLVQFSSARSCLPEYARFEKRVTEIQVRTILQHVWAEIEHDIQYKAVDTIPSSIRRRFVSLAGLVEIADREFQAISNEDSQRRTDARLLVSKGELRSVELTPDALKAYLDDRYGSDGRMSAWSYEWMTRLLKRLGFENFDQIDSCVSVYNDDRVSRAAWSKRMGQVGRFELVLLAAMGDEFINRHPWAGDKNEWFETMNRQILERFRDVGIKVGDYRPEEDLS